MPLHLLGKKSWNVYNPASIARVKSDEAAAAAREAADEQRLQELDAERRSAILRGKTPPPLPEETTLKDEKGSRRTDKSKDGHERKRRRLAGEDETDMDIRLAKATTDPKGSEDITVLKLRKPTSDAPLEDHAGNINLFPVDLKEAMKREKNAEAEKEKKKKEQALEDQYTMRFSNAAGKGGFERPWYVTAESDDKVVRYPGFADKDVWGNEDPLRKDREQQRIALSDPFAFMQKAQVQLKKAKEDKKKWAGERDQELRELRATQEREWRRDRHGKRKRRTREDEIEASHDDKSHERDRRSKHHHHHRSRSDSGERGHGHKSPSRHERKRSRSRDRERQGEHESDRKSSRHGHERSRALEKSSQRSSGWRDERGR